MLRSECEHPAGQTLFHRGQESRRLLETVKLSRVPLRARRNSIPPRGSVNPSSLALSKVRCVSTVGGEARHRINPGEAPCRPRRDAVSHHPRTYRGIHGRRDGRHKPRLDLWTLAGLAAYKIRRESSLPEAGHGLPCLRRIRSRKSFADLPLKSALSDRPAGPHICADK